MPGLISIAVAALVAGNVWLWFLAINHRRQGKALVAFEARRPVPWRGWDLAAVALGYFVASAAAAYLLAAIADGDVAGKVAPIPVRLMVAAAVNLATVAAAVGWLRFRRRADWVDLGFAPKRLHLDLILGLSAFVLVSVPIYALQAVLTQWIPSEHPIVKAWQSAAPSWELWSASLVSAVLVAPLTEEFLFRVLLQGWFESLGPPEPVAPAALLDEPDRNAADFRLITNPYAAPAAPPDEPETRAAVRRARAGIGPVVMSSLIFALMHLSHGPDPVPLFFLSLALGYLYRQTHRIWPSVVAHLCLNACTMAMLFAAPPSA